MCKIKELPNSYITTSHSDKRCFYHPRGSSFVIERLGPERLCLEAFNSLYPYCFSFLHIPENKGIFVHCPNPQDGVVFRVYRTPTFTLRRIKNIIAHFINIFYPIDIIRYRIFIEVADIGKNCPYKYRQGETFELNLGQKQNEACPAAFNSTFPSFFVSLAEDTKLVKTVTSACPDHRVNVQLRLENNETKVNTDSRSLSVDCISEKDVIIEVMDVDQKCPINYLKGQEYRISDILETLGIPCLSAFHVVFPYYLILLKGGKMPGYYTTDRYAAFFQCPSIKNKVEMMIKKEKKSGDYFLCITRQKECCPKGFQSGQKTIPGFKKQVFCLYLLHSIGPFVNSLKLNEEHRDITIACPGCENQRVVFRLFRKVDKVGAE